MVLQQYEFKGLGKLHRHWNCSNSWNSKQTNNHFSNFNSIQKTLFS